MEDLGWGSIVVDLPHSVQASFVPKTDRYTALWDKNNNGIVERPEELTSIGHILISPELETLVKYVVIPHEHGLIQVSDHYPIVVHLKLSEGSTHISDIGIRITSLLPNPHGDEVQEEMVTIKNLGSQDVNLVGCKGYSVPSSLRRNNLL